MNTDRQERLCDHCELPVEIRNPSGYCDHLYYPEMCKVCQEAHPTETMKLQRIIDSQQEQIEVMRAGLKAIIQNLGTGACTVNKCEGCAWEVKDSIERAKEALSHLTPSTHGKEEK